MIAQQSDYLKDRDQRNWQNRKLFVSLEDSNNWRLGMQESIDQNRAEFDEMYSQLNGMIGQHNGSGSEGGWQQGLKGQMDQVRRMDDRRLNALVGDDEDVKIAVASLMANGALLNLEVTGSDGRTVRPFYSPGARASWGNYSESLPAGLEGFEQKVPPWMQRMHNAEARADAADAKKDRFLKSHKHLWSYDKDRLGEIPAAEDMEDQFGFPDYDALSNGTLQTLKSVVKSLAMEEIRRHAAVVIKVKDVWQSGGVIMTEGEDVHWLYERKAPRTDLVPGAISDPDQYMGFLRGKIDRHYREHRHDPDSTFALWQVEYEGANNDLGMQDAIQDLLRLPQAMAWFGKDNVIAALYEKDGAARGFIEGLKDDLLISMSHRCVNITGVGAIATAEFIQYEDVREWPHVAETINQWRADNCKAFLALYDGEGEKAFRAKKGDPLYGMLGLINVASAVILQDVHAPYLFGACFSRLEEKVSR